MHTIIMRIPEGNGYTIPTLRERAVPHIKQAFYSAVDIRDGTFYASRGVVIDLLSSTAKEQAQMIKLLLEVHYGLAFDSVR